MQTNSILLACHCSFTFAITLSHRKFITADVAAVFVNNQHGIQRQRQDFDKKFVFEGVHSKEVDRRISKMVISENAIYLHFLLYLLNMCRNSNF